MISGLTRFKDKNFSFLWTSHFISIAGIIFGQMALITIVMILYSDTGWRIAWVTFFSLFPSLFLSPFLNCIVNKFDRKKIMVIFSLLSAALVTIIPFITRVHHSLVYICFIVLCVGTLFALISAAKISIISNIVNKEGVVSDSPAIVFIGIVSAFASLMIAGYMIKFFGPYPMFFINGFMFLVSAIIVKKITINIENEDKALAPSFINVLQEIKEGFKYIIGHQATVRLAGLNTVFSLLSAFFYINILNYASTRLHLFSQGYGFLLLSLFLSFVSAAILLKQRMERYNRSNILFVGFGIISLTNALMMFRPNFTFSILILIFVGIGAAFVKVALASLFKLGISGSLKENVFSARRVLNGFVFFAGLIIAGKILSKLNSFHIFVFIWFVSFITTATIYMTDKKNLVCGRESA